MNIVIFGIDLWTYIAFVLGGVVFSIFTIIIASTLSPGLTTWIYAGIRNLPIVWYVFQDGFSVFRAMKKKAGSMIFNANKPDEFLDKSMIDNRPVTLLHGKRIQVRVDASAIPIDPTEDADTQRVMDHIQENKELYPLLSKFKDHQEFVVFGGLGHEPQTARELLARHCRVETQYIENGKIVSRPEDDITKELSEKVDKYVAELELLRKNVEFLPRRGVYVDLNRVVNATQLRIASQILKRYRAEIEAFYRAKYAGVDGGALWKGLLLGGGGGLIVGAVAAWFLKGG